MDGGKFIFTKLIASPKDKMNTLAHSDVMAVVRDGQPAVHPGRFWQKLKRLRYIEI